MKVSKDLQLAYDRQYDKLEGLQNYVKPRIDEIAGQFGGTCFSRIKQPESILLKTEKAAYKYPFRQMNDLFACMIVLPNVLQINDVLDRLHKDFTIIEERRSNLKPDQFAYDDINLTCKVLPDFLHRDYSFNEIHFEIQVKTLLQQAWGIASHDLIYKSKRKTWGLTRIAGQLRTLLEMADSVLANIEVSANMLHEQRDYLGYQKTNQIVSILETTWDKEILPNNLYRVAQTVDNWSLAKMI